MTTDRQHGVRAWRTVLAAIALAAPACGGPAPDAPRADASDTLVVAVGRDVATFIEWFNRVAVDQEIIGLVFRPLAELDPATGEFLPALAESWRFADGGRVLDVTLSAGATWQDGTPVTSRDVAFTYRMQTDAAAGWIFAADKAAIKAVETPDERTARFVFERPYAESLFDAMLGSIYPAHLLETIPVADMPTSAFSRQPVGSGPYRVARRQKDVALELAASASHLGGPPRIPRILVRIVPDKETRGLLFEQEEVDLLRMASAAQVRRLAADPRFAAHQVDHRTYLVVAWNTRRPPFDDARVRRALAGAIDRARVRDIVFEGRGAICDGPVPPGSWAHVAGLPVPAHDPAASRRALEDAGWRDGDGDGVREKDGRELAVELAFAGRARIYGDTATLLREALAAVGAAARVVPREGAVFWDDLESGNFDAALLNEVALDKVDLGWIASRRGVEEQTNYAGWIDDEADAACEAGRAAPTRETAREHWVAAQRLLARDQPYTFLVWRPQLHLLNARVSGVSIGPRGLFATVAEWEIGAAGPGR